VVVLSGGFKKLVGMGQNFLSCDRDQVLLLPPNMVDWLPEDHLARFVIETVDQLDLEGIYAYYRRDGRGRPAHDPAMMVGLVLYAYAVGVTSSRAIERRCVDDLAFRVITVDRQPDHATVARFLVRHRRALSELFFGVLALCARAGMVRVGVVAVDSTKLAANAALEQNRTLDGLRAEAERIIEEAIATDAREDELYGDKRGDELPDELADPKTRTARIKELLEQAQAEREAAQADRDRLLAGHQEHFAQTGKRKRGRPPDPGREVNRGQDRLLTKKYNVTDPDSVIVRHRGMLMQGYNVQAAVADGQVILAAKATSNAGDGGQLEPIIDLAQTNLAQIDASDPIEQVLADTGYWDNSQNTRLTQRGIRVLVPPHPRARAGAEQMRGVLDDPAGQQDYQRRQQIIEPVFAHWKHIRQITRVWRRGRHAVQAEIDLIATSHNLLKLYRATPATA
jgi:transposase